MCFCLCFVLFVVCFPVRADAAVSGLGISYIDSATYTFSRLPVASEVHYTTSVSSGSTIGSSAVTYNTYEFVIPFRISGFQSGKTYSGNVSCYSYYGFSVSDTGMALGGMALSGMEIASDFGGMVSVRNSGMNADYNSKMLYTTFDVTLSDVYFPDGVNSIYGNIYLTCNSVRVTNGGDAMSTYCKVNGNISLLSNTLTMTNGQSSNAPSNVGEQKKQTEELEKQTEQLQQQTDTQKGIWESIKEFFAGFFDGIINALISVFVPEDDYFSDYFNRLNTFFSERLGLLYEPIDILVRIVNAVLTADSSTASIPIPEISWDGQTILSAQNFTFDDLLSNPSFKALQDKLHFVTSVIMVGALLALVHKKSQEVMRN